MADERTTFADWDLGGVFSGTTTLRYEIHTSSSGLGHLNYEGTTGGSWCNQFGGPVVDREPTRLCKTCVASARWRLENQAMQERLEQRRQQTGKAAALIGGASGSVPTYPHWQPAARALLALETDDYAIARVVWDALDPAERDGLAVYLLGQAVWKLRRNVARQVERNATSQGNFARQIRMFVTDPDEWARTQAQETWKVPVNLISATQRAVQEHVKTMRLELTDELLQTVFAVKGQRVTWGEATVEQHRMRAQEQVVRAVIDMDDAARHEAAVRLIEAANVTCLNEIAASRG